MTLKTAIRDIAILAALALLGFFASGGMPLKSHAAGDPVIVAAGDICADSGGTDCAGSASLIDSINPDRVLTLGDNSYPDGSSSNYADNYNPQWGRFNPRVRPSPGNHDFHTTGAQGYLDYFGSQVPGYMYSYDLGSWHLISLPGDEMENPGNAPNVAEQNVWLQQDLAAHSAQCVLAYWHEPRFSSGTVHGDDSGTNVLWQTLYSVGADVILAGHEHNYERFAKQNPSGQADPNGIREFVAGIGGADQGDYPFGTPDANSQVRGQVDGVLKMTLHPGSYDWEVMPNAGQSFTDSGSDTCNNATQPPPTTSTTTTTTTTTTTPTTTAIPPPTGKAPPFRFMYMSDQGGQTAASYGFNVMDVGSKSEADATPNGSQGQIWVGDYNNSNCSFEQSDSTVAAIASAAANDPKVAGFFFSDEPDPFLCPNAIAQHIARDALIKVNAPNKYTLIVIDSNSGQQSLAQMPLWEGVADYVGLDPYPCHPGSACDFGWIDTIINAADSAGLNYWGVVQAFAESGNWRFPTVNELNHMLDQWANSKQTGYAVFAWNWDGNSLADHPDLLSALANFNGNVTEPPPTTSSTTTTTPTTTTIPEDELSTCRDKLDRINAIYHSSGSRNSRLNQIHAVVHEAGLCNGFTP